MKVYKSNKKIFGEIELDELKKNYFFPIFGECEKLIFEIELEKNDVITIYFTGRKMMTLFYNRLTNCLCGLTKNYINLDILQTIITYLQVFLKKTKKEKMEG